MTSCWSCTFCIPASQKVHDLLVKVVTPSQAELSWRWWWDVGLRTPGKGWGSAAEWCGFFLLQPTVSWRGRTAGLQWFGEILSHRDKPRIASPCGGEERGQSATGREEEGEGWKSRDLGRWELDSDQNSLLIVTKWLASTKIGISDSAAERAPSQAAHSFFSARRWRSWKNNEPKQWFKQEVWINLAQIFLVCLWLLWKLHHCLF